MLHHISFGVSNIAGVACAAPAFAGQADENRLMLGGRPSAWATSTVDRIVNDAFRPLRRPAFDTLVYARDTKDKSIKNNILSRR